MDDGFHCVGCAVAQGPFKTRKDIYNHLVEHVFAKHKVPEKALDQLLAEYQAEIKAIKAQWSPEAAQVLLDQLSLYFGEPVKPISQYCDAFRTWHEAIEQAFRRAEDNSYEKRTLESMVVAIREVSLMVSKSNLLARLLYEGEKLRTEPCPIHQGRWSGCVWGEQRCPHCMSGDNVTGWVAPKHQSSV